MTTSTPVVAEVRARLVGKAVTLAVCTALIACGERPATPPGDVVLAFDVSPPIAAGTEAYRCYVFDLGPLEASPLASITWDLPTAGPVTVHHVSLYAIPTAMSEGPVDCTAPDFSTGPRFASYTPGQAATTLPAGVALTLPSGTARIGVEAHVLRGDVGNVPRGRVVLQAGRSPPAHLAVWMEALGDVPDLPPRGEAASTRRCTVEGDVHVVAAWPHMHRMGRFFASRVVRADGTTTPLLRVEPWDFTHQPLYEESLVLHAGDAVDLTCDWQNTSDVVVHGSLYSTGEMCSFAFIAWPAEAAHCAP